MTPETSGPAFWIKQHALLRPNQTALVLPSKRALGYEELAKAVALRSSLLEQSGVRPGDIVAICIPDKTEQRLLRWAVHWSGGIEVIIDDRLSIGEIKSRLRLLGAALIIGTEELDNSISWHELLKKPPETPADWRGFLPRPSGRILFTTGTSGNPRAVLHENRGIESAAHCNIEARHLTGEDRLAALLPPYHAAGSLFEDSILCLGGTICIPEKNGPDWVVNSLLASGATITSMLPSMLFPVLKRKDAKEVLQGLRLLNYAGESASREMLVRLGEVFAGQVTRGYGQTEAGPFISMVSAEDHAKRSDISPCDLGHPAPGVEVRVDPATNELEVRSNHIMKGYLNDPEATQAKLSDGWLRTGDAVEIKDDRILLLGRMDQRIRSGGEWIYPLEVEAAFEKLNGVKKAIVVARTDERWGQRPVAYLVVDRSFDPGAVALGLSTFLARFKWPDWIDILDEMPLCGPGKIDCVGLKRKAEKGPGSSSISLHKSALPNRKECVG